MTKEIIKNRESKFEEKTDIGCMIAKGYQISGAQPGGCDP